MPVISFIGSDGSRIRDFFLASLTQSIHRTESGSLTLMPDNMLPNSSMSALDESGPVGWSFAGMPAATVGYYANITPEGFPQKTKLMRQSTTPFLGSWVAEDEIVPGIRTTPTSGRKSDTPDVDKVPSTTKGYKPGRYGAAFGYSQRAALLRRRKDKEASGKAKRTPAGGITYFDLLTGQVPRIYVPDSHPVGATHLDIYLTKPGGTVLFLQLSVPINELSDYVDVPGPLEDKEKAPAKNTTGLGSPQQLQKGRDYEIVNAPHDMREGRWTPCIQFESDGGLSLLSRLGQAIIIRGSVERGATGETDENGEPVTGEVNTGYRKNTGILVKTPGLMRRNPGLRWTAWFRYEPLSVDEETGTGGATWYRAYPRRSNEGTASYFDNRGAFKKGIVYHGYPPESEPAGLLVGSVQEEPPAEDTTQVESPDPASAPDRPGISGKRRPAAGDYLGSTNALYDDETVSIESGAAPVNIGLNEMIRVTPPRSVNRLADADFSQLDAQGKPVGWSTQNIDSISTNTFDADAPGTLKVEAAVSTGSVPGLVSTREDVTSSDVFTVAGIVLAERIVAGTIRLGLRQYDETGVLLSTTAVADVSAGALPVMKRYHGADVTSPPSGSTALASECAYITLFCGLAPASGQTTVNGRGTFSGLKLLPFAANVRSVLFGDEEEPDAFEVEGASVPGNSFVAFGPAPTPVGSAPTENTPPVEILDFEANAGALPTGWTQGGNAGSITTTSPIHGTRSFSVSDSSGNTSYTGYVSKTFSALTGDYFAARGLYRVDSMSTRGYPRFHYLRDTAGGDVAYLRLHNNGELVLVVKNPGEQSFVVGRGIKSTDVLDVEIQFVSGAQGLISVGLGVNGRRSVVFSRNFNFGSRHARTVLAGVLSTYQRTSKYALSFDRIVITERGDIVNREQPTPPPNYTPLPPDRPILTPGTTPVYRNLAPPGRDGLREILNQAYLFLKPGDVSGEDPAVVEMLDQPLFVKPGMSYTFALFLRWTVFSEAASGFRVKLTGDGLTPMYVEPGEATGNIGEMAGMRSWHPTVAPLEDDWMTFGVPDFITDDDGTQYGYTEAQIELVATPGVYVWQEMLFSQGVYATFAEREAKRTLRRATTGNITAILDGRPEAWEAGLPAAGLRYSEFGVKTEESEDWPRGVSLDVFYSTSPDRLAFSPETTNLAEVLAAPQRFLRLSVDLAGDGFEAPEIPAGGIFLRTWHQIGVLLREDGTHLPGGAFVGNLLVEEDYPETTFERVAGHVIRIRESDDIGRVGPITVTVATEEARQLLSLLTRTEDLRIEVPTAGGTVAGRSWLVRCGAAIEWGDGELPPGIVRYANERGHRQIHAVGTIEEAEILESAPLRGAASPNVKLATERVI